jgi:ubiquinone/menaquinone biosynthesis C-methylase UbiE
MKPTDRDFARRSRSFDTVPHVYDDHRPGYPSGLAEAIVNAAGIGADSSLLEVGSGTGKGTELFAPLGCSILCVEPGANLVALAKGKFADYPCVRFACSRFEDWPLTGESFDLVYSSSAFHWVDRDIGAAKAADALKPGGFLALFWNMSPGMTGPLAEAIQRVYAAVAPAMSGRHAPADLEANIADRLDMIERANRPRRRYGPVRVLRFPWRGTYTTAQYLGLLNTYSDHICLEEPVRSRLLEGVAAAIDAHGGTIERPYVSVLYLARKEH